MGLCRHNRGSNLTWCCLLRLSKTSGRSCRSPGTRSGELRTQKLKSHLVRAQSLDVLPLKPGVGQYIDMHATLTARDFYLVYFYPSGPFTCMFFPKPLPISPVLAVANTRFLCIHFTSHFTTSHVLSLFIFRGHSTWEPPLVAYKNEQGDLFSPARPHKNRC